MTERQAGRWRLVRTIVDLTTASVITCEGRATLAHDGGRLRYDEVVTYQLAGRRMRATRTYFYETAGPRVVATFADGRSFFTAPLEGDGTLTAIHYCGPDIYTGTADVSDSRAWATQWDVTGAKALRIRTRYTRDGGSI